MSTQSPPFAIAARLAAPAADATARRPGGGAQARSRRAALATVATAAALMAGCGGGSSQSSTGSSSLTTESSAGTTSTGSGSSSSSSSSTSTSTSTSTTTRDSSSTSGSTSTATDSASSTLKAVYVGTGAASGDVQLQSATETGDGSQANPYRRLQSAFDAATAGTRIRLNPGTYVFSGKGAVLRDKRGTAAAPIVIEGAGVGSTILHDGAADSRYARIDLDFDRSGDGSTVAWGAGIITLADSQYVVVRNLKIDGSGWVGVRAWQSTDLDSHITVRDNVITNTYASAVYAGDGPAALRNVHVYDNDISRWCVQGAQPYSGILCQESVSLVGVNGFDVAGNTLHDGGNQAIGGGGEGIDAKDGSSHGSIRHNTVRSTYQVPIYVDAWNSTSTDIEITGNYITRTATGIRLDNEDGGQLTNVRVHDNVIDDVAWTGIETGNMGVVSNVYLYHNTLRGIGSPTANARVPYCASSSGCSGMAYSIAISARTGGDVWVLDNVVANGTSSNEWASVAVTTANSSAPTRRLRVQGNLTSALIQATGESQAVESGNVVSTAASFAAGAASPHLPLAAGSAGTGDAIFMASLPTTAAGSTLTEPVACDGVQRGTTGASDPGAFTQTTGALACGAGASHADAWELLS